jgi:hypothetical protein
MAKQIKAAAAAVLALAFSIPGFSQTAAPFAVESTVVPAAVTVQQLAPQLVDFAGSLTNFQSLVNGLALGLPVTLVTLTPEGLTQTVTFTPSTGMTPLDIARTLELARQNLIARGIARPTAQQLGVALAGGILPTAAGALPITGLIPLAASTSTAITPATTSASSGAPLAVAPTPVPAASGLAIQVAPTPRFTSDSPLLRNTSDSPLPAVPAIPAVPLFGTSASPVLGTSASPSFNTSNSPALAAPAGGPSPAFQLQNRR